MQKIRKRYIFSIIFILVMFRFYSYAGFPEALIKMALFVMPIIMFGVCWKTFTKKSHDKMFRLMQWLVIANIVAMCSAFLFWEQSFVLSWRVMAGYFTILFFFYLCKTRPSVGFVENIIWIFGILYCVLWTYAFFRAPEQVFGFDTEREMDEGRGIFRINFVGRLSLIFAYFLALNKYFITKKKIFISITIVLFVFIVLQLTRQLILWTAAVTAVYALIKYPKRSIWLTLVVAGLFAVFSSVIFSEDSPVTAMMELSERQADSQKSGEEDIRITEYKYYFTEYSRNIITDIVGNGFPHSESAFGAYNMRLNNRGLFLSDVGYARMFADVGLIGLILYILLFYRGMRAKLPQELEYVPLFFAFLIPANIAASWYATPDCQIAMSIGAYLIVAYGNKSRTSSHIKQ